MEKVEFKEIICDDSCDKTDGIVSPSWHEDILREREEALKNGTIEFLDWEVAEKDLRKIKKSKI